MAALLPQDFIARKRDDRILSDHEIADFVAGITSNAISDAQIAAFGMAVFFRGMTPQEGAALTLAMRDSGEVMDWTTQGFDAHSPIVDKHSTGGVGDKVSFMLAALAAACGAYVPMIAGRGLGHTGGTIDKLNAIKGYDVNLDSAAFTRVVKQVGCSIIGQTKSLAPADRRFYAVRDVTATVESIPLITASILSKKLAAGLNSLVMDVKYGSGAFMKTADEAKQLAENIVRVAGAAGVPTSALLTDMNQVLGRTAGNSIELLETVDFLKNPASADPRLMRVVVDLVAEMLVLAGLADNSEAAGVKIDEALTSGAAAEKFAEMVSAHGGPADLMDNPDGHLKLAPVTRDVFAPTSGFLTAIDVRAVGQSIVTLGGGRQVPGGPIDTSVGLSAIASIGDTLDPHQPFCQIHAASDDAATAAAETVMAALTVTETAPKTAPVVLDVIR